MGITTNDKNDFPKIKWEIQTKYTSESLDIVEWEITVQTSDEDYAKKYYEAFNGKYLDGMRLIRYTPEIVQTNESKSGDKVKTVACADGESETDKVERLEGELAKAREALMNNKNTRDISREEQKDANAYKIMTGLQIFLRRGYSGASHYEGQLFAGGEVPPEDEKVLGELDWMIDKETESWCFFV